MSSSEPLAQLANAAPPTAVSGLLLFGITLPDLILYLTLAHLVVQLGSWVYDRFIKKRKGDSDG